jgi:tetratricopeptide (TPR) repeat protein
MSENVERVLRRVEKLNAQGKYDASVELLKPLLLEQPENIQLINIMGVSCDLADKKFMAASYFHKSADHYFQKKFYDKALAVYKKILKVQPDDALAYEGSAKIYESNGNFNEAANFYKSAAQKYLLDKNKNKAVALFKEAVKLAPFDQRLKLELIELYKKLGETQKSIEMYLEFVDNFIAKGDYAGARTILENILKLDSGNIKALTQLADVAAKLGDKEQTLAAHQKILSFNPDNAEALFSFAIEYYERFQDIENTVNMIKKAHRLQPENLDILFKLKELCPNDLEVRQALKVYYLDHNDRKSAVMEIMEIANIFEHSKNKSMADKLRSKANEMLREIEFETHSSLKPAVPKEKVVSLDTLTNSRLSDTQIQENDGTNPYYAGLLEKTGEAATISENKPVSSPKLQTPPDLLSRSSAGSPEYDANSSISSGTFPASTNIQKSKSEKKPLSPIGTQQLQSNGQSRIETIKYPKPKAESNIAVPPSSPSIKQNESASGSRRSAHQDYPEVSQQAKSPYPVDAGKNHNTVRENQVVIDKPGFISNSSLHISSHTPVIENVKTKSSSSAPPSTHAVIESKTQHPLSEAKTETGEFDSVIIEDVDIDPNSLTIKVSTASFKTSEIMEKIAKTAASQSQKDEKKHGKDAAGIVASNQDHEQEHRDVSDLLQKLPDERIGDKAGLEKKFEVLKPEITKEMLKTDKPSIPSAGRESIPPPHFLKARMDVKVVQLSKDDPLKSSTDKLAAMDDGPEIFLKLTDIDELDRSADKFRIDRGQRFAPVAEVSKRDLRILQEKKPSVHEQNGFDLQKVIHDTKVSDKAELSATTGKKLFSDDTANLSKLMNNIFNSMISDARIEPVEDDETRFNLAMSYMEMGLYDDAIVEFRSVVDKKDFSVKASSGLAMAYSHKQDNLEAVKWYVKASSLLPEGSEEQLETLYSAGDLCLSLNDYANAQKYLMEVYRLNPGYHGVIEKLEYINSRSRRREEA